MVTAAVLRSRKWTHVAGTAPEYGRDATILGALLAAILLIAFAPYAIGIGTLMGSGTEAGSLYPTGALPIATPSLGPRGPRGPRGLDPGAPAWTSEPWYSLEHHLIYDQHELPMWDPFMGYGAPFAGAMQPQPFYPLTLAVAVAPSPLAVNWLILTRLFLAGWFAALYLRLFSGRLAALAAGIATAFTGYFLIYFNMPHLSTDIGLPMMLWATELCCRRFTPARVAALGGAAGLIYLGGMPETIALIMVTALAYATARITWLPHRGRRVAAVLAGHALGLAVGAVMIVPFVEFVAISANGHPASTGTGFDDQWQTRLFTELVPSAFGKPTASIFGGWSGVRGFFGASAFGLALVAMLVALRERSESRVPVLFFSALAFVVLLKRFGFPLVQWLGMLPGLHYITFPKYGELIVGCSIALVAGFGVDYLERRQATPLIVTAGFGAALSAITLLFWQTRGLVPSSAETSYAIPVAIALGAWAMTAVAAFAAVQSPAAALRRAAGLVIVAVIASEPWAAFGGTEFWSDIRPAKADPYIGAPFLQFLAQHVDRSRERIVGLQGMLSPNWSGAYGFSDPRSLNAVYPWAYLPWLSVLLGDQAFSFQFTGSDHVSMSNQWVQRWSELSSIRYFVARDATEMQVSPMTTAARSTPPKLIVPIVYRSPAVTIFRNPTIVERLTLYHHAFVMKNQLAAALALRFPSFDVLRDVALEAPASTPGTASSGDHIDISLNDALHVEARVTTASPAVLVQTDTFYPGWVAYVDGKPTTIMRADAYFRAVAVPAGTHVVDIRYESVPVIAGEACSMLALLCLLSLLMAGRVRRNLASPAGPVGLVDQ